MLRGARSIRENVAQEAACCESERSNGTIGILILPENVRRKSAELAAVDELLEDERFHGAIPVGQLR